MTRSTTKPRLIAPTGGISDLRAGGVEEKGSRGGDILSTKASALIAFETREFDPRDFRAEVLEKPGLAEAKPIPESKSPKVIEETPALNGAPAGSTWRPGGTPKLFTHRVQATKTSEPPPPIANVATDVPPSTPRATSSRLMAPLVIAGVMGVLAIVWSRLRAPEVPREVASSAPPVASIVPPAVTRTAPVVSATPVVSASAANSAAQSPLIEPRVKAADPPRIPSSAPKTQPESVPSIASSTPPHPTAPPASSNSGWELHF